MNVQTIAYDLCKSLTLDACMHKYKPSVLAACVMFLGFQLQFEIEAPNFCLASAPGRNAVAKICNVFRLWIRVLE